MFQSIKYFGYNTIDNNIYTYEYELVDSDFSCLVKIKDHGATTPIVAVIQEYSKRKLNVAANLIKCFQFQEKEYGWSIAQQIVWIEKHQPLFTPQLKADTQKYLLLI